MKFAAVVALVATALQTCLGAPPAGAITIAKDGSGKYTSIAKALADTSSSVYYIYPGNYTEQVVISRANIKIYGETSSLSSYSGNTVTISRNMPASVAGSNDASGTVRVTSAATGVRLYNLNIENTYGKPVNQAQAIALSAYGAKFGVYGCQLRGVQDTLLANAGTQYYAKTLIRGSTDFIFGQTASIWITNSQIETVASGYITASGRSSEDANWYVIDHSTITGSGSTYLGRPWRNYARVVFQYSNLGSNVNAAGWSVWNTDTPNTDHAYYGEYQNTGAGASGTRVSWAKKLTAAVSINSVLGSDVSWIDSAFR
jgi:pectinesterase